MRIISFSEVTLNEENNAFIAALADAMHKLSKLDEVKHAFKWLSKCRWYLLLGHQDSGKTTFIKEAEEQILYEHHDSKKQFSIYVCKESVFLEIAQKFLTGTQSEAVWIRLLQLFRKKHIRFSGVLICISLYQLLTLPKIQRQAILNDIKRILSSIKQSQAVLIWLVFTFLDIVNGFNEFFDDQLDLERQQSFGLEIDQIRDGEELMELFNKEFQDLLDHINQRLVRRLHLIRDENTRVLATDFPMQFEQMGSTIRNVLRHLFKHESYINYLKGIYFVSGKQISNSIDRIVKPIAKQVVLSTPLISAKKRFSRSYFIHDIVVNRLNDSKPSWVRMPEVTRGIQIAMSGMALTVTLMLAYSFKHQVDQLSHIENAIQNYKHQMQIISSKNDSELIELLSAIENINNIKNSIKTFNRTWLIMPLMSHMSELKHTVSTAYSDVLTRQFIPRLSLQFENVLSNLRDYSDEEIYSALKGYIMLMDKKRFDPVYISLWFRSHWEHHQNDILSKEQIKGYSEQLYTLLKQAFQSAELNHQLVFKSRQHLKKLSLPKIVFLKVKNLSDHSGYHLAKINNSPIPVIFTKQGYKELYLPQVNEVLGAFDRGDWVLGHLPEIQPGQLPLMRDQIDALYFTQYKQWWLNTLSQHSIGAAKDLKDAEIIAAQHASIDNELFNVINALIINTKPFEDPKLTQDSFNDNVSSEFQAFHHIKTDTLSKLVQGFYELARDLQLINGASDPERQAFLSVKSRFTSTTGLDPLSLLLNATNDLPHRVQKSLLAYHKQVWYQLIQLSERHINHQWQEKVLPYFHQHIEGHYPVKSDATNDIPLTNFGMFFGYGGLLDSFFENNILPFIETDLTRWRHVVKDNLYLSFRESIIDQFERAYIIRKMFFTQKSSDPSFEFAFQPIKFAPNVSSVVIDFAGQQVYDYQGSHKITSFKWPGNTSNDYMTVLLENYKGDIDTIKFVGPWSLFKLVQQFGAISTKDLEVFKIDFKAAHTASQYRLIASSKINPFIGNIVDKFTLSEELFEKR